MNIFILGNDIQKCARYHCDKHVIKMILESTQILCTVCNQYGINTPYRSTHIHHPCVVWTGKSIQNWRCLKRLTTALNREFKYRYGHIQDHRAYQVFKALKTPPLPNLGLTPYVQAMPNQYKVAGDAIMAYRQYYIGIKKPFATWRRRRTPKWFVSNSVFLIFLV